MNVGRMNKTRNFIKNRNHTKNQTNFRDEDYSDKMKNVIDSFSSWLSQVEEQTCQLEDRSLDIIQSEENKARMKKELH